MPFNCTSNSFGAGRRNIGQRYLSETAIHMVLRDTTSGLIIPETAIHMLLQEPVGLKFPESSLHVIVKDTTVIPLLPTRGVIAAEFATHMVLQSSNDGVVSSES